MCRRPARLAILAAALLAAILVVLGAGSARADCVTLSAQAESRYAIPIGVLQAMAMVESGVGDTAWPWSINIDGVPTYFDNRAAALKGAEQAVRDHGGNVALGCMQISLRWHGQDFRDLDQLLDAPTNVAYAAQFLVSLRRSYGSWVAAVMRYHASKPVAQNDYLCRVVEMRAALGYQGETAAACGLCPGCR